MPIVSENAVPSVELRSEDEIIAAWGGLNQPVLTIRCHTYNHAPYIEDALRGFLIQETDFPYRIVVHDDASTDGNSEVIRKYEKQYPRIIRAVYQKENQHSQGNGPGQFTQQLLAGEFLASCEGDDCWIDPQKLQLQVNALRRHPESDISIHPARVANAQTGENSVIGVYCNEDAVISVEDLIVWKHGQIPTASMVIRAEVLREIRAFRQARPWLTVGDIYTQFFAARRGGAVYINRVMSLYRHQVAGSWTHRLSQDNAMWLNHRSARIRAFNDLDHLSGRRFHEAFARVNSQSVISVLKSARPSPRAKIGFFFSHVDELSWLQRLLYSPLAFLPYSANALRAIQNQWKAVSAGSTRVLARGGKTQDERSAS